MAFVHGRQQVVKVSDLSAALTDISSLVESAKPDISTDRPTTQTFGNSAERHQVTGLRDYKLALSSFWQPTSALKVHGKSTNFLFDQYALRSYLNKGSFNRAVELPETQTFGEAWKRRQVVGLHKADVSFDGLFDGSNNAVDAVFRAQLGVDPYAPVIHTLGYNGFAIGSLVDMLQICQGAYSVGGAVNGVVPVSGQFSNDDVVDVGVSLHDLTAETGAANFASVDETAATAAGGVGHIHVTAWNGTTATVKIQHSTDNAIWNDLITFTTVTGLTKERIELSSSTTVNRYVRAIISAATITSMTFVVAFGRRSFVIGTAGTHRHWCGLLLISTAPTFSYGPEGGTTGKQRQSGSCRLSDYKVDFDEGGITKWSATLVNDGAVAFDTYP